MRRTAAGSALVCAGFALGAAGATVAGPQVPSTAIAFLRGNDAPYVVATHHPAAPTTAAVHKRSTSAVRGPAVAPRVGVARISVTPPATATPDARTTSAVSPEPAQPLSLDVALDPARTLDATAVGLCRILSALPTRTGGQH